MKVSDKQEASLGEEVDACEHEMRLRLMVARDHFRFAKEKFDALNVDHAVKQELWFRFNATERRLMKDTEGKEWS